MKRIWNAIKAFFVRIKDAIKAFVAKIKAKFTKPVIDTPVEDPIATEAPEPEAVKVSWIRRFGRGLARVLSSVGTALTTVARWLYRVAAGLLTVVMIVAILAAVLLLVVGLATYKGFQALFMLFATPHYINEGTADHNWRIYGQSWHPRYFTTMTLHETEEAIMTYKASKRDGNEPVTEDGIYFGMFGDTAFAEAG